MRWTPALFRVHRWLSWLAGVQVVAWVAGGLVFAWLPFQPWVKGRAVAQAPRLELTSDWAARAAALLARESSPPPEELQAVVTAWGPALRLGPPTRWLRLDGEPWRPPDGGVVTAFAQRVYRGDGRVVEVQRLDHVPPRLAIVKELGGRRDVWRVRFDDALSTCLYFDGPSGEYVTVRTTAWVWYDFFWRLHIMDYADGEDFNGTLLRGAALAALGLTLAGVALSATALRRASRRRA